MTKVATEYFIQCDITYYDECKQYSYIFLMLLHLIPQLWVVVRVWLDKQTGEAYTLAFRKIF